MPADGASGRESFMKVICDRGGSARRRQSDLRHHRRPHQGPAHLREALGHQEGQRGRAHSARHRRRITLRLKLAGRCPTARRRSSQPDKLRQIISAEDSEPTLTLETETILHIKGQDAHFKVFGYNITDYPPPSPRSPALSPAATPTRPRPSSRRTPVHSPPPFLAPSSPPPAKTAVTRSTAC